MNRGHEGAGAGETRRGFIKKTASAAVALSGLRFLSPVAYGQGRPAKVALVADLADKLLKQPPVRWAIEQLGGRRKARNVSTELRAGLEGVSPDAVVVLIAGRASKTAAAVLKGAGASIPDVPEAVGLVSGSHGGRSLLLASGSDVRGLVYAILELADRVEHGSDPIVELQRPDRIVEQPANPIRSIARLFTSDVEDKSWYYDKPFWEKYLSMLMTNRINRFAMTFGIGYNAPQGIRDSYFYFTYPFLLSVPGYNVKAVGLSDRERDRNMEMLRFIVEQTALRGLHCQLALWTHAYDFRNSPDVNYRIEGLNPQNHAAYCRDALRMLLESCPQIDGVTFRCHSESGVPQGSYEFWKTVFDGVVGAGKKRPIDLHSKGIDFKLIDIALATGMPVTVSPKYWAEHQGLPYHQAAIQAREWQKAEPGDSLERQRLFTRYGYVPDITFGPNSVLRGHWADRLGAIDKDLADMEKLAKEDPGAAEPAKAGVSWARAISRPGFLASDRQFRPRCQHLPPAAFHPGKPIPVEISVEPGYRLSSAVLHYRHVDQSDAYQVVEMSARGGRWRAEIPAEYADSAYPLLYYIELHDPRGAVWLYPGLNASLTNQPYFVISRA